MIDVTIKEWETIRPEDHDPRAKAIRDVGLDDPGARELARQLQRAGVLTVLELRLGLEIRATSYVGRIRLGALNITVVPKLGCQTLLSLFRYAYGLCDLLLFDDADLSTGDLFQDLLLFQLRAEARELCNRGLVRRYERKVEDLASPRGRIEMARAGTDGPNLI